MEFELKVNVLELSEDDIETILSGASCGTSYWCSKMSIPKEICCKYSKKGDSVESVYARALKEGFSIAFTDMEGEIYTLNYDNLLKGVETFIEKSKHTNIHEIFREGNEDMFDMDFIIQYALFGEIIFG